MGLKLALHDFSADVILPDSLFYGTLPMLFGAHSERPAIIHLGGSVLNVGSGKNIPPGPGVSIEDEHAKRFLGCIASGMRNATRSDITFQLQLRVVPRQTAAAQYLPAPGCTHPPSHAHATVCYHQGSPQSPSPSTFAAMLSQGTVRTATPQRFRSACFVQGHSSRHCCIKLQWCNLMG
jgi:hypothetical protein